MGAESAVHPRALQCAAAVAAYEEAERALRELRAAHGERVAVRPSWFVARAAQHQRKARRQLDELAEHLIDVEDCQRLGFVLLPRDRCCEANTLFHAGEEGAAAGGAAGGTAALARALGKRRAVESASPILAHASITAQRYLEAPSAEVLVYSPILAFASS